MKTHVSKEYVGAVGRNKTSRPRIDLNVLLERAKKEERKEKKKNILIVSAVASVSLVVFLMFSL